jgi:5-methylcytosine-specific restriction endonuclease McrA
MTLRLLKPTMSTLRGTMPMLQHRAPQQVVGRLSGGARETIRRKLLARSGGLCECPDCQAGYPIKLTLATMHADHIVPLELGGGNEMANHRALHIDCHARITAQQALDRAHRGRLRSGQGEPDRPVPTARPTRGHIDDDMCC